MKKKPPRPKPRRFVWLGQRCQEGRAFLGRHFRQGGFGRSHGVLRLARALRIGEGVRVQGDAGRNRASRSPLGLGCDDDGPGCQCTHIIDAGVFPVDRHRCLDRVRALGQPSLSGGGGHVGHVVNSGCWVVAAPAAYTMTDCVPDFLTLGENILIGCFNGLATAIVALVTVALEIVTGATTWLRVQLSADIVML